MEAAYNLNFGEWNKIFYEKKIVPRKRKIEKQN
jgi:hypothetical protein